MLDHTAWNHFTMQMERSFFIWTTQGVVHFFLCIKVTYEDSIYFRFTKKKFKRRITCQIHRPLSMYLSRITDYRRFEIAKSPKEKFPRGL